MTQQDQTHRGEPDTFEPSDERKAEIQAARAKNSDDAPYRGVVIRTLWRIRVDFEA